MHANVRKCLSKSSGNRLFRDKVRRIFRCFRVGFLKKANARPLQKACGRGRASAFLRKNMQSFAGKRPHFPWKTSRLSCIAFRTCRVVWREAGFQAERQPSFCVEAFFEAFILECRKDADYEAKESISVNNQENSCRADASPCVFRHCASLGPEALHSRHGGMRNLSKWHSPRHPARMRRFIGGLLHVLVQIL